jgi:MFS transporter, FSR family, fosmidomycin resistance protein
MSDSTDSNTLNGADSPLPAQAGFAAVPAALEPTTLRVLLALSLSHLLNDVIQALLPAIYPLLKSSYGLTFTQIGLITFVFQTTASLFQPLVGQYTDRRPMPYSLAIGMTITLGGLVLLARASSFPAILLAAALVGTGSSIFHPEASRLARLASGGRHGLAQSLFQVGGNLGSALGPLLAAWVVMPRGQVHLLWFSIFALTGIAVMTRVGGWYQHHLAQFRRRNGGTTPAHPRAPLSGTRTKVALLVLAVLIFSKFFYLASLSSYYTFFLIEKFHVSAAHAQHFLFLYLLAAAIGTLLGGPLGDRYGRKIVIWVSILGVTPFSILLPHVSLVGCGLLSIVIGLIIASAFSAILVYAQELVPGKVGLISGLFFGFAFGMAGIGSALLGRLADFAGIEFVFNVCGFLPLLGLATVFLPDLRHVAPEPRRP